MSVSVHTSRGTTIDTIMYITFIMSHRNVFSLVVLPREAEILTDTV